ncbi:hypothetical protein IJ818_05640 [bacterium]|nr:hypothetical protein [bacterium]
MNEEELALVKIETFNVYDAVIILKKAITFDEYENGVNSEYLFLIENIENCLKKISSHF